MNNALPANSQLQQIADAFVSMNLQILDTEDEWRNDKLIFIFCNCLL